MTLICHRKENKMLSVRLKLNDYLSLWVVSQAGPYSPYKTHNDYIEDLIRRDMRENSKDYSEIDACGQLTGEEKALLVRSNLQGIEERNSLAAHYLRRNPLLKPAIDEFLVQLDN